MSAIEKNLKRDIQELDWEIEATKRYEASNKPQEGETTLKPKLFQKKQANHHEKTEFNNTGETRATITQTVASNDWDLPETYGSKPQPSRPAQNTLTLPPRKPVEQGKTTERSVANDWDLGEQNQSRVVAGGAVPSKGGFGGAGANKKK